MNKKIATTPPWVHAAGIILWIILVFSFTLFNIILNTGIKIRFGLLGIIFVLIICNDQYKKAIENKKNPYSAYFLSELYIFILIMIFGTLYGYFGFWIALISTSLIISLLVLVTIIYEKKTKK